MSTPNFTSGPRAALRCPRRDDNFDAHVQRVHDALLAEPRIVDPSPDMPWFQRHIDAYRSALAAAKGRVPGAVAERRAWRQTLVQDLHHLRDVVQAVAETIASPADAAAFIVGCGFPVRRRTSYAKLPLRATHGDLPGTVLLVARAVAPVATYYWQYSLDGQTWVDAGDTLQANTLVTGLASACVHHFRFRARARTKEMGWCQPVTIVVH
jgi:hypothetical protein